MSKASLYRRTQDRCRWLSELLCSDEEPVKEEGQNDTAGWSVGDWEQFVDGKGRARGLEVRLQLNSKFQFVVGIVVLNF